MLTRSKKTSDENMRKRLTARLVLMHRQGETSWQVTFFVPKTSTDFL